MPTTKLDIGLIHTLVQNVVYALPARTVRLSAAPFANIQVSNAVGGTFLLPIMDAAGQCDLSGGFIRDTVGGALVKLSAY